MAKRSVSVAGPRSRAAFAKACAVIPGGVNSPVRAFKRLGGVPPVVARGAGPWIEDVDGRRYVDCVLSWGPLLHGHAHAKIVAAITSQAAKGTSYGAPTELETELASLVISAFPGMQRLRMTSSGTEACMAAMRLARAATGRELILKFDGCYHGHADQLLVAAGSGAATLGVPDSAGVPKAFAERTLVAPYNDLAAVERLFAQHPGRIASVMVEPVAGNMGLVLPRPGFLEGLRRLCSSDGALLIFDEVMTGFRVGWGGWQNLCRIRPDLTCLGKVIGGGLPAAAYGGRADLMRLLAPEGPCYQAGTLSGNPLAVAAGLCSLRLAARPGFYERVGKRLTRVLHGIRTLALRAQQPLQLAQAGTMWGWFPAEHAITDFASAARSDLSAWERIARGLMQHGVWVAPSPFEAAFWSSVHGPAEERHLLSAWAKALGLDE